MPRELNEKLTQLDLQNSGNPDAGQPCSSVGHFFCVVDLHVVERQNALASAGRSMKLAQIPTAMARCDREA